MVRIESIIPTLVHIFQPPTETCDMWSPHWPRGDWHWRDQAPGARCLVTAGPLILLIIPASITHHNVTNHSLSRPTGLSWVTRPSDWWINHFPGLPFADLLQRWSVSPDEKISHHLHSSSRTPALNLLYEVSERIPLPTFNIPNSHAHWDWIKMPNKIRILNRFSGVIDIFCPHVLTMSRLLPIFN